MGAKQVILPICLFKHGRLWHTVTPHPRYGWLDQKLNQLPDFSCRLENMPDPVTASKSVWLPFMKDQLGVDEETIVIGHSSGACAAVRYAENEKVAIF